MYELIILFLLTTFPGIHGYHITRIANDALGPWVKMSNGTLYPLLTRLEQAGLIKRTEPAGQTGQADRQAHAFAITEAGRQRFHEIMLDTSSNLSDYQRIFHLKLFSFNLLEVQERLYLLDHYINYCQRSYLHCQAEAQDFARAMNNPAHNDAFDRKMAFTVMEQKARLWHTESTWAQQLRAELAPKTAVEAQSQAHFQEENL